MRRREPETRSDACCERAWMRKAVSEDDICEYTIAYDDELVRCDAREGRESRGGTGVRGFK